ncbi:MULTISPECIES: MarR family winged helix-turn-helix transcriptional regulator [unclassified Corynebacterium]|uniref:MarR family winged helix-turn-helix transcriptional regulator n=1 Tax=unclassified Corynebacterium TaxID=2624378 RepID=UPI0029CA167B|nr:MULTISPECIES: MarR family transcriptional regulator [unclassified Corynebacterium]WPF66995.1 MarR family transcriptional regulator [Corynebacterium sp. 22KM0430]WPF69483.1 MarR family transcriptional regulator [Corynebacterium sp. 21KM1197]
MAISPRWLTEEEQALWRLLLAAMRKIERVLDETLQVGQDLSGSEFGVLATLSEEEGRSMRLRDLCNALDWDRSRASHLVTRMVKRGLVTKGRSEEDARGVEVSITEEGMERLRLAAPEHVESVRRLIFDHLTGAQAEGLAEFLEGVLAVDNVPGAPGFSGTLCEDVRRGGGE